MEFWGKIQITIRDICALAEISHKSFYRYFGSKEDCLHALIDRSILDASEAYLADNSPVETRHRILEHYFAYRKQMRHLLDALCQNQMTNKLFERSMICVTQEEREFRNYLNSDNQNDAYEQMLFIVIGITCLILNWHLSDFQKTAAQMSSIVDRLLDKSLIPYEKSAK